MQNQTVTFSALDSSKRWLTLLAGIMSIMHKQEMDSVGIQLSGGNLNNFLTLCCRSFVYYSQDTNTFH